MSGLSADEIKALSEKSRKKHGKHAAAAAAIHHGRPTEGRKLSFSEDGDTATLTIVQGPPMRGREGIIGVLTPFLGGAIYLAWTQVGVAAGLGTAAACIALVVYLVVTAPPLKLQLTRDGDFILFASNPRRPKWAGKISQLDLQIMRAQTKGEFVGWLGFSPRHKVNWLETIGPFNRDDVETLKGLTRWHVDVRDPI